MTLRLMIMAVVVEEVEAPGVPEEEKSVTRPSASDDGRRAAVSALEALRRVVVAVETTAARRGNNGDKALERDSDSKTETDYLLVLRKIKSSTWVQ